MLNLKDKLILVTGGSGFLALSLIPKLLERGAKVRAMARGEGGLIKMKQKFPSIEIFPGDISDATEVRQAMKGVQGVVHAGASKHVGLAQRFVRENVKSNIIGSLNVCEQASLNCDIEFVVGISTDKSALPSGNYGYTKILMEGLFKQYSQLCPNIFFRLVRYGNIIRSTGSVLEIWEPLIRAGKEVIITDREATRFYFKAEEAVEVILDCLENATSCEPWVATMKALSVGDLLDAMIEKYSNGQTILVKEIGLQPGENKHERIHENGPDSSEVARFTKQEILDLI